MRGGLRETSHVSAFSWQIVLFSFLYIYIFFGVQSQSFAAEEAAMTPKHILATVCFYEGGLAADLAFSKCFRIPPVQES